MAEPDPARPFVNHFRKMLLLQRPDRSIVRRAAATALVAAVLCGCSPGERGAPPETGDTAVAEVAGDTIWRSDVRREARAQNLITGDERLEISSPVFRRVLDEVVDQRLLAAEARRRGLDEDAETVRRIAAARDRVLGDRLIEDAVRRSVNDAAVQALYREQVRLSQRSEQIRAREIVSRSEADAVAARRLLDSGAAFESVAESRSADARTRFGGGDLGWFELADMPAEYGQALAGARPGQVVGPFLVSARPAGAPETSPPVQTWVIARVEGRRPTPPPSLEEARPQIVRFLSFDQVSELVQTLRRGAEIRYLAPGLSPGRPAAAAPDAPNAPTGAQRPAAGAAPGSSPGTAAPATVPNAQASQPQAGAGR